MCMTVRGIDTMSLGSYYQLHMNRKETTPHSWANHMQFGAVRFEVIHFETKVVQRTNFETTLQPDCMVVLYHVIRCRQTHCILRLRVLWHLLQITMAVHGSPHSSVVRLNFTREKCSDTMLRIFI